MSSGRPLDILGTSPGLTLAVGIFSAPVEQPTDVDLPIVDKHFVKCAVDPTALNQGIHELVRVSFPHGRDSDIQGVEPRQVAVIAVVNGPPPEVLEMADRSRLRDVQHPAELLQLWMLPEFLM
jgi:hypothetical protein